LAVEESWVKEELLKPIPAPPPEPEPEPMLEVEAQGNGIENGGMNGDEEGRGKRVKMDEEAEKID
jgi:hypothetical protein